MAQAIIDVITEHGGVMTLDDLSSHDSEVVNPVSTEYKVRSASIDTYCIRKVVTCSAE